MRRLFPLLPLAFLLACGKAPGRSPADAFEAFRTSLLAEDFGGVWDLLTQQLRKNLASAYDAELSSMSPHAAVKFTEQTGLSLPEAKKMSPRDQFTVRMEAETARLKQVSIGDYARRREQLRQAKILDTSVAGDKAVVTYEWGTRKRTLELAWDSTDGRWRLPDFEDLARD